MTPKPFLTGLLDPTLQVEQLDLNSFIEAPEDAKSREAEASVAAKLRATTVGVQSLDPEIPHPLTPAEAEIVGAKMTELRSRIGNVRGRISKLRSRIDAEAAPEGSREMAFAVNIANRPSLKRAIQKVFGVKTSTITYSMYLAALEALRNLEVAEATAYVDGDNG